MNNKHNDMPIDHSELVPADEAERINELKNTGLLQDYQDTHLEHINELAASVFAVPIAFVGLMDVQREWLKSACGISKAYLERGNSICQYPIFYDDMLVIPDTHKDERFKHNKYVKGSFNIQFYAGEVIHGPVNKQPIGVLCLIDHKPRSFGHKKRTQLRQFVQLIEHHISLLHRHQTA